MNAQTRTAPAGPARQASPELDLDARLAAVDAAMTLRLEQAALAVDINTCHIELPELQLADVVRAPLAVPRTQPYATPVAALLQRAHRRLLTDGWCAGALVGADGSRCLLGAIRIEAGGDHGLEQRGLQVLIEAIRRRFPDADTVPAFNDAWADGRMPLRLLDQAADLAHARGL